MLKLKKRDEIIIYIVAAAACVFLIEKFLFSGIREKIKNLRRQIKVEESKLAAGISIRNKKDEILGEWKNYHTYLDNTEGSSDREIAVKFLKEVEVIAQESGISIISLAHQNQSEQVIEGRRKFSADLRAEAAIDKLFIFLNKIQKSGLLIKLDKLTASPKDEQASALKLDTTISITVP